MRINQRPFWNKVYLSTLKRFIQKIPPSVHKCTELRTKSSPLFKLNVCGNFWQNANIVVNEVTRPWGTWEISCLETDKRTTEKSESLAGWAEHPTGVVEVLSLLSISRQLNYPF